VKKSRWIFGAAALLAALCAPLALADKDDVTLISRQSTVDGGFAGDRSAQVPSISADGNLVAFTSDSDNLSAADVKGGGAYDIFVRDIANGTTILASRVSGGGAGADGTSDYPALAANGGFVAFESGADNLSTDDDDNFTNIFVHNLATGATTLVSRGTGGVAANGTSNRPSISADGRFVAFQSTASSLPGSNAVGLHDVFVRDLQTNTTILVSQADGTGPGGDGNDDSYAPSISADGRYVAFDSVADNLSTEDDDTRSDIYVRDLQQNTTTLVSRQSTAAGGAGGNGDSYLPAISADGRHVAFESTANNLSADDNDAYFNDFERDLDTGTTTLISRQSASAGGAGGDANVEEAIPAISADGRFVAFTSPADNLSTEDDNTYKNTFVRDVQAQTTTLVSRQSAADGGAAADDDSSYYPAITPDGRYVAFASGADNLSTLDTPHTEDIFVRDVLGPPVTINPPDETPPDLTLAVKHRQKIGKPLRVTVTPDEQSAVVGKATAATGSAGHSRRVLAKKKLKYRQAKAVVPAGVPTTLVMKPSKRTARKLKRAGKATASIELTAADDAGNVATKNVKVKLR
jgi:Tol biopolymer transport system component